MDWLSKILFSAPPNLDEPPGWPKFLDFEHERLESVKCYISGSTCAAAALRDPYCTIAVAKLCHANRNKRGVELSLMRGLDTISDQKMETGRLAFEDNDFDLLGMQLMMSRRFFSLIQEVFDFRGDSEIDKIFASLPIVEKARQRLDAHRMFGGTAQYLVKASGLLTSRHLGLAVGVVVLEAYLVRQEPWVVAGQEDFWWKVRRTKNLSVDETVKTVCVRVLQQHDCNLNYLCEVDRKKNKAAKVVAGAAPVSACEAIRRPSRGTDKTSFMRSL